MDTVRTKKQHCLNCHRIIDAVSDVISDANVPKPGDVTICLYCGHLMEFGPGLTVLEPSPETLLAMAGNEDMLRIQRARGYVMKNKP